MMSEVKGDIYTRLEGVEDGGGWGVDDAEDDWNGLIHLVTSQVVAAIWGQINNKIRPCGLWWTQYPVTRHPNKQVLIAMESAKPGAARSLTGDVKRSWTAPRRMKGHLGLTVSNAG